MYKMVLLTLLIIFFLNIYFVEAEVASKELFVAQTAVLETELIGFTRSRHIMDLISKESAFCQKVYADIGDVLGEEGVFVRLETIFIDLQIEKNKIMQELLTTRINYLKKEHQRYRNLLRTKNIDESSLDRVEKDFNEARQELKLHQTEEINLKERLKDHTIKAKPGWYITAREVEPGEWIRAGQKIGQAADYSTLLIPFSLSPEELRALKSKAETISLFFPDFSEQGARVNASIEKISPRFDPETRKTKVDLEVNSAKLKPRGGLRAVLSLVLTDPSGAVMVPESALISSYGEYKIVRETGEIVSVLLLGKGTQGNFRVKSSKVQPGDRFMTNPNF
jgi:hypothetical protein